MTIKIKNSLFLALFLVSCSNSTNTESTENAQDTESHTTENQTIQETTILNKTQCFINEFPYQDGQYLKDIEELILTIEDQKVVGSYNWLPAEKDQRTGNFEGTLKDNKIDASYVFMQEGIKDTVLITIVLENDKAIISSVNKEDEELGLNATLSKMDCKK